MAEASLKKLRKQLEDLEAREHEAKLTPIEATNDTLMAVTFEDQKKKLRTEIEKCEKVIRDNS
jgi:hypothetical protein